MPVSQDTGIFLPHTIFTHTKRRREIKCCICPANPFVAFNLFFISL